MSPGESVSCGGAPKPNRLDPRLPYANDGWDLGCLSLDKAHEDDPWILFWSTERTQAVIALGCPKPVPCDVCDGQGFYMVNAHGVQEIKCGECDGTGVKPAPSR